MAIETSALLFGNAKRSLIETAMQIAYVAHAGQTRKDSGSPYVIHPFMAALNLTRHGFSDTVVAATLVHDVLEDTPVNEAQLREILGDEITDIVRTVSEDKTLVWEKRKEVYIQQICQGSEAAKAVSISDKIHNLQSLCAAHAAQGSAIWSVFNRGRESKAWFEHSLLAAIQNSWSHPLVDEYAAWVKKMDELN